MKKEKLINKLLEFKQDHMLHLTPDTSRKGKCYKGTYRVDSHLDLMFLVMNLIKVCIVALEENEQLCDLEVPNPKYNVMEVLRFVTQLIPSEELALLDKFSELLENIELEKKVVPENS